MVATFLRTWSLHMRRFAPLLSLATVLKMRYTLNWQHFFWNTARSYRACCHAKEVTSCGQ